MAILDLPESPGFATFSIKPESVVATSESGFTKKVQVYEWAGKRYLMTASTPIMSPGDARLWEVFFLRLNGRAGTFYLSDALVQARRGRALGSPLISAINGDELSVSGFAVNVLDQVVAGDWLQIGDRIFQATSDASSDASGAATFTTWPTLSASTAIGTAINLTSPRGEFRLVDIPEMTYRVDGLLSSFDIVATSEI